ncbi:MAG: DUF4390 domain-containing protein [Gammaproteobacteria bacterium]
MIARRFPRRFPVLAAAAAWLCCGLLGPLSAQAEEESRFEVRSAYLEPVDGVMQLNATLELGLSATAQEALRDGVPVTVTLESQLRRQRRFLPDAAVASLEQRWRLQYHALSDRWLVTHLNTGQQTSWTTQAAALEHLARPRGIPIIDAPLLRDAARYEASVRATAEVGGVPDSLKVLMFWVQWKRTTDWYTWTVRP